MPLPDVGKRRTFYFFFIYFLHVACTPASHPLVKVTWEEPSEPLQSITKVSVVSWSLSEEHSFDLTLKFCIMKTHMCSYCLVIKDVHPGFTGSHIVIGGFFFLLVCFYFYLSHI